MAIKIYNFKQFTIILLQRLKEWFWYKWLFIEVWWAKRFSKRYSVKELMQEK